MRPVYILFIAFLLLFSDAYSQDTIRAYGDSFTESAGVSRKENTYPSQLAKLLGIPVLNFGIGGQTSTQITDRLVADSGRKSYSTIIWEGRNNYPDSNTVYADIARSVAALGHDHYLIVDILNGNYTGERNGTSGHSRIQKINEYLAKTYGPHYVPLRQTIISEYNPLLPYDSVCFSWDVTPHSLRSDTIHLNDSGYLNVARKIAEYRSVLLYGVLPITFLQVKAIPVNRNHIQLSWTTADEKDVARYIIEKSIDAQHFFTAGFAYGHSYTDTTSSTINYYRITAVDKNERMTSSNVVQAIAQPTINSIIRIASNPIRNNTITLQFNNILKGWYKIQLIDINARILNSKYLNYNGETFHSITTGRDLQAGFYFIQVTSNNGFRQVLKLVKL